MFNLIASDFHAKVYASLPGFFNAKPLIFIMKIAI